MKKKILVLNAFLEPSAKQLEPDYECIRLWELPDQSTLTQHASSIVGVMSSVWDSVNAELINALPQLKIIAHMGVGVDAIDLKAAAARNIVVANTPDVVTDDTADIAIGMMIMLARQLLVNDHYVRSGSWQIQASRLAISLNKKTVGIVGLGKIGMAIAKRAEAFNMNVCYYSRQDKHHPRYQYENNLIKLAQKSDFLIIAAAGTSDTKHLIDEKILNALGAQSYLINIARGFIVNELELVKALKEKRIAGAGLDVFENEPHVPAELLSMENVVLQPHMGSATVETRQAMYQLVADNIRHYLEKGCALTPVSA
jgi:lactate dehydrogenase-like 2-hydroxyacid dehydrogenase